MRVKQFICMFTIALLITSCGGAERKANKSVAAVNKEKLSLVEDYQKCMKKAGTDEARAEACETYRKAAEALK